MESLGGGSVERFRGERLLLGNYGGLGKCGRNQFPCYDPR